MVNYQKLILNKPAHYSPLKGFSEPNRQESSVTCTTGVNSLCTNYWPEKSFQLRLVQGMWWEHFIDSSLLWLLTTEACRDVDRTNTGHAVEEQIRLLSCQDTGEGEQARIQEAKEWGVEVTVDNGCYSVVIVSEELVKGSRKPLEVDSRLDTGLERCCQHYNIIQLWSCSCRCGEAELVLKCLPCRTNTLNQCTHRMTWPLR